MDSGSSGLDLGALLVASYCRNQDSFFVSRCQPLWPKCSLFYLLFTYAYVVTNIQEGRGHGGSGRRKEEVKDIKEPATEESKAPHDAKAARANWRG